MASQMMPQYMPTSAPYGANPCNACQQAVMPQQPMYVQAQPAYYAEPSCGYMEAGCGEPFMGNVGYGPSMSCDCGSCGGGCDSGCCDGGVLSAPDPAGTIVPRPAD
jgi:hypothetical protein